MTLFGSFEIGRKALRVQHKGMDVSGQNVANANTLGYTRQRADMESVVAPMVSSPSMAPGRGVIITDIIRVRSEFYHSQIVSTTSDKEYWEARHETYLGLESVFVETDEVGISKYLGEFFDTWQELSVSPEESAVRSSLRESAVSLTRTVKDTYQRLEDQRLDYKDELGVQIKDLNRITDTIAELNEKIRYIDIMQQTSNELLDQLDLAVEELAELIDIRVHHRHNGTVEIFSGGRLLVQEDRKFNVSLDDSGGDSNLRIIDHRGKTLALNKGKVLGLLEAVNKDIPNVQKEINNTIQTMVTDINRLHRNGYGLNATTQNDFFKPITDQTKAAAMQFEVSDAVINDSANIAASPDPQEPGNGKTALEIARLRDHREPNRLNGYSITEYYRGIVTAMGAEAQDSERMKITFGITLDEISELHESISGVNLDEEMLNMIQFQHSWNAAGRFLSTVDEMLTVLFSELRS